MSKTIENPYESPSEKLNSISSEQNFTWLGLLVSSGFAILNVGLVVLANQGFKQLLEEFGIELPVISELAYQFAFRQFIAIFVILLLAAGTFAIHFFMKARNPKLARTILFFAFVVWMMFSFCFALALLLPIHAVFTGLSA